MNIRLFATQAILSIMLISPCLAQPPDPGQKLIPKEIRILIDSLDNALSSRYIFPDKAALMMSSIRKNFKSGAYGKPANRAELSRLLQTDLQEACKDGHLSIAYNPYIASDIEHFVPDTARNREAYEQNIEIARQDNFSFKKAEVLPGNIGYLRWDVFSEFVDDGKPTVEAALRFVAGTSALIIDMRNNGGGSPDMVLQLQSYFFDHKTRMNDIIGRNNDTIKRWTDPATTDLRMHMPVYILTSGWTFSGAEDFTYGLKYAGRAIVVGDTTGGGAHPTQAFSIGQGFVVFIPNQRSYNHTTHTDWEGTGVWPDAAVPADQALEKAQSLIYTQLLSKTTEPRKKDMLHWQLTALGNRISLAEQVRTDSIKHSREQLLTYAGEYMSADPGNPLPSIFVILKSSHLYRHLPNGAEDVRLVPVSATKFVYNDDTGRSVEFVTSAEGKHEILLTTQDGVTRRGRK
jgi:hypothetical protein